MEMPVYDVPVAVTDTSRTTVSEIRMDKLYSGVYEVPCDINGLPLKFILDTGASTVSISSVEASVAHNQRAPLLLGQSVLERFGTVTIDRDMVIICVVGNLAWQKGGYEAKAIAALEDIPTRMICYGGSDYNISFLVRKEDKIKALNRLSAQLFDKH